MARCLPVANLWKGKYLIKMENSLLFSKKVNFLSVEQKFIHRPGSISNIRYGLEGPWRLLYSNTVHGIWNQIKIHQITVIAFCWNCLFNVYITPTYLLFYYTHIEIIFLILTQLQHTASNSLNLCFNFGSVIQTKAGGIGMWLEPLNFNG